MRKYVFFFILIASYFDVCSQSVDETIKYADKLYGLGDFNKSLTYYQRALFFSSDNSSDILSKIGDCYFQLNEFLTAGDFYDSAFIITNKPLEKENLIYKKLDCYIFIKDFKDGLKLINDSKFIDQESVKANFYKGLLYFGNENYYFSQTYFLNTICDSNSAAKDSLTKLFDYNFKYPDPEIASVLSSVIPGAGLLYSGDIKNAANSFILIGALVLISVDMYFSLGLIDPLISIFPWLNRYYKGGIENAYETALSKRNSRRNLVLNQIINLINGNIDSDMQEK